MDEVYADYKYFINSGGGISQLHLEGIMELDNKYSELRGIELLAYHDMGRAKWQELGYDFLLKDLKSADNDIKENWAKQFGHNMQKIVF